MGGFFEEKMANLEETEISFQQQEVPQNEPPSDLSSFQFVPEKIVDFSILQVWVKFFYWFF